MPAVDEHALRAHLIQQPRRPASPLVVTMADWIADPDGLFVADFDLLTRLPGLEELDIVATPACSASGFHQRLHDWLPGLDTEDANSLGLRLSVPRSPRQYGRTVTGMDSPRPRRGAGRCRSPCGSMRFCGLHAVVFARPLPDLYLACEVFGGAGIPAQAVDPLPLAAEPATAAWI